MTSKKEKAKEELAEEELAKEELVEEEIEKEELIEEELDEEDYEELVEKEIQRNAGFLEVFHKDLTEAGLKEGTIRTHLSNADFYLNTYLQNDDPTPMEEGLDQFSINDFLGNFFIRKCMWSTPATIKSTAASLKKFYKSMADHGVVPQEDYAMFALIVKISMEDWQETCESYNSGDDVFYW